MNLLIRGLSKMEIEAIDELAQKIDKSRNQFLLDHIREHLITSVYAKDKKIFAQVLSENNKVIEANTQILLEMQKYMKDDKK